MDSDAQSLRLTADLRMALEALFSQAMSPLEQTVNGMPRRLIR